MIENMIKNAVGSYSVETLAQQYRHQKDLLVIDNFLPREEVVQYFLPEVEHCTAHIHRVNVPGFKKSGSVSQYSIKKHAPMLYQLYQSQALKEFVEKIIGEKIVNCPDHDAHAVALYYYTEPGDRIGVHYDKSFYRGKRFTLLLGMVQDSQHSQLICYPGATKFNRRKNPLRIYTHPGTFVLFNGDSLWHEVSALGDNERRAILTMEFLTDPRISKINQWISGFKDRLLYFGKKDR